MTKEIKCKTTVSKELVFSIANYDEIKASIESFKQDERYNLLISSKEDLKEVKELRTEIRKRQNAIKEGRLEINKMYMEKFNSQAKDLENLLKQMDEELKAKVDSYENPNKAFEFKLTLKTTNLKFVEKIKALCEKENIEYKEEIK